MCVCTDVCLRLRRGEVKVVKVNKRTTKFDFILVFFGFFSSLEIIAFQRRQAFRLWRWPSRRVSRAVLLRGETLSVVIKM